MNHQSINYLTTWIKQTCFFYHYNPLLFYQETIHCKQKNDCIKVHKILSCSCATSLHFQGRYVATRGKQFLVLTGNKVATRTMRHEMRCCAMCSYITVDTLDTLGLRSRFEILKRTTPFHQTQTGNCERLYFWQVLIMYWLKGFLAWLTVFNWLVALQTPNKG